MKSSGRFALLGASRGLGWACYQKLFNSGVSNSFLLMSRQIEKRRADIEAMNKKSGRSQTETFAADFAKDESLAATLNALKEFNPTCVIYFAGGGPYGIFESKKWSDHLWSIKTTFLFPASLTHALLLDEKPCPQLNQIILIGSSVAESKPDPNASSYCAAKHALKGLVSTLQVEGRTVPDGSLQPNGLTGATSQTLVGRRPSVLLYSPGYMQTDLLPLNSLPRIQGLAKTADEEAENLIALID